MVDLNRLRGVSARSELEGDISPSPKKAELKEKMEALSVSIRRKKERKEQPPPTNGEMPVAGKYNLTQDEATVETAYKNGKTKTTEDIKVSRVTDTVEENKTVVNTTVIAEKERTAPERQNRRRTLFFQPCFGKIQRHRQQHPHGNLP